MPKFSVIVPTRGDSQSCQAFLKSLCQVQGLESLEILVIINPPQPSFELHVPDALRAITKLLFSEAGVNCARNRGIEEAKGDLLFFFDDDCVILAENHFAEHERLHRQEPHTIAWGGHYKNLGRSEIDEAYNRIQNRWLDMCFNPEDGSHFSLLGGNFSIKRKLITELFNPEIVYGGSETDFFLRLYQKGGRFKFTPIPVGHNPSLTLKKFITKAQLQAKRHKRFLELDLLPDFHFIPFYSKSNSTLERIFYQFFINSDREMTFELGKNRCSHIIKKYYYLVSFFLENKSLFLSLRRK
jgi:glycosyltransferase involved in cell wall biosynthesis